MELNMRYFKGSQTRSIHLEERDYSSKEQLKMKDLFY